MGKYSIALSDRAKGHLSEWKKSGQVIVLRKIERIFLVPSTRDQYPFLWNWQPRTIKIQSDRMLVTTD